jgi:hypothetical protein
MRTQLIRGMLLASAVTLLTAGCGQQQKLMVHSQEMAASSTPAVQTPTPTSKPTPAPELKQAKVKLYYTDNDETKLVEKEGTISYKQDGDQYAAAFEALKKSSDSNLVPLFSDVTIKNITFDKEKGDLKLDLSFGTDAQLGAPGEDFFLQAIKKTAFQFSEIKSIYVQKDGAQVESLMGHMDLPYPIKRAN